VSRQNSKSTSRPIRRPRDFSSNVSFGAETDEVDERGVGPRTVVVFEFEAYPEPKSLSPLDLRALYQRYKSFYKVADIIGASEGFARQNANREQ
jgi:hypothetical protein